MHPLVGETKGDDVPAEVRVDCYRALLDRYYPAGPRAALGLPRRHALRRPARGGLARDLPQELRLHPLHRRAATTPASARYYGTYDAQRIFDAIEGPELGIVPLRFEHSFYCRACGAMASAKTCPHAAEEHVFLSGTKVREMLGNGERPPVGVLPPRGRRHPHRRLRG